MAWAGSQGGVSVHGTPLFALLVGVAFLMQWLAFVPAYLRQTERFFDITGSATYLTLMIGALVLNPAVTGRSILLLALVAAWAMRLGTFLFRRIHRAGKDKRFDAIKLSFPRFLMTWMLQGLWVTITLAPALAATTTLTVTSLGVVAAVGAVVWACGFTVEVVADTQKSRFRDDPTNRGRFMRTGLWAWSRHPNYFGEIVLWIGIALVALPVLRGWQLVTLVSPLFVTLLLTRVSGVPMLEQRADEQWGGQPDYEAYKARTPVLIPLRLGRPRTDA
jgi:steroid 5-alpha reductase family enzyme